MPAKLFNRKKYCNLYDSETQLCNANEWPSPFNALQKAQQKGLSRPSSYLLSFIIGGPKSATAGKGNSHTFHDKPHGSTHNGPPLGRSKVVCSPEIKHRYTNATTCPSSTRKSTPLHRIKKRYHCTIRNECNKTSHGRRLVGHLAFPTVWPLLSRQPVSVE